MIDSRKGRRTEGGARKKGTHRSPARVNGEDKTGQAPLRSASTNDDTKTRPAPPPHEATEALTPTTPTTRPAPQAKGERGEV